MKIGIGFEPQTLVEAIVIAITTLKSSQHTVLCWQRIALNLFYYQVFLLVFQLTDSNLLRRSCPALRFGEWISFGLLRLVFISATLVHVLKKTTFLDLEFQFLSLFLLKSFLNSAFHSQLLLHFDRAIVAVVFKAKAD